jgi:hypothetical protein
VGDDHKYACSPGNKSDCSDTNCAANGNCRPVPLSVCGQPDSSYEDPNAIDDASARRILDRADIKFEPGVSLAGVKQAVIDEILSLANGCLEVNSGPCNVRITAGTNGTHSEGACSHGNGYKVDIRSREPEATKVNAYIKTFASAGLRCDKRGAGGVCLEQSPCWRRGSALYCLETDHWDMVAGCGR